MSTSDLQNCEILKLPHIDIEKYFQKESHPDTYELECEKVANALHQYGILIIKDPRVNESHNNTFLDLMERYFTQSDGIKDARPEYSFQVGVTPEFTEKPVNYCNRIGSMGPNNKPLSPCPPELDPKWRFFWRIGPRPEKTAFSELNHEQVIPEEFPEWSTVMNEWGLKMIDAVTTIAEMAAHGFHMPDDAFASRMINGPHLLAPTGSDFNKFGDKNTVLAGYHTDLNFLTIHGKSRFPGLRIWSRKGQRMTVMIPDGCLLVQAGQQIEYLTGGHVLAGFHEVIVNEETIKTIERKKACNESLWRVSSTLFSHIQSDQILEPLSPFNTEETKAKFPSIVTGQQVRNALEQISLWR